MEDTNPEIISPLTFWLHLELHKSEMEKSYKTMHVFLLCGNCKLVTFDPICNMSLFELNLQHLHVLCDSMSTNITFFYNLRLAILVGNSCCITFQSREIQA